MAQTALKLPGDKRIVLRTQVVGDKTEIIISNADENFKPIDDGQDQVFEDEHSEEEFHRSIRSDAQKFDHLVKQFSTNPEWNSEPPIDSIEEAQIIEE